MARLVCLFIEDNEAAEAFVKETEENEGRFLCVDPDEPNDSESVKAGVMIPVAMFAVPTQFCECEKVDKMPITRGANLGWWIHRGCNKPIAGSWQAPRNLLLAKQDNLPARDRTYSDIYVHWTFQPPFMVPEQQNASTLSGKPA